MVVYPLVAEPAYNRLLRNAGPRQSEFSVAVPLRSEEESRANPTKTLAGFVGKPPKNEYFQGFARGFCRKQPDSVRILCSLDGTEYPDGWPRSPASQSNKTRIL